MTATSAASVSSQEQQAIREHLPLVHHVAVSMRSRVPSHVPADDLVSAALVGLLQAVRAYDEGRGVPFAAYATTRIRGAVLDELRSADWATRSLRAKARSLREAENSVGSSLGEAAAAAGLTTDEARRIRADVQRASVLSIDGLPGGERAVPVDVATPEAALVARERIGYLRDAVDLLPDRLRQVVVGIFFEERSPAQLAAEMGVTESRISHMRTEATSLLREALRGPLESGDADAAPQALADGIAARRRAAYCAAVTAASDHRRRLDRPVPRRAAVPA